MWFIMMIKNVNFNLSLEGADYNEKLSVKEYQEESRECPQLIQKDFSREISKEVEEAFHSRYGMIAIDEEGLAGYLTFEGPWDGFYGKVKGVCSPLCGSAF